MATNVSGPLKLVTDQPATLVQVSVRAPRPRPHAGGMVVDFTTPATVTDGVVEFPCVPGPAVLSATHAGVPQVTVPLLVPDSRSATLEQCIRDAQAVGERDADELSRILESVRRGAEDAQGAVGAVRQSAAQAQESQRAAASSASAAAASERAAASSEANAKASEETASESARGATASASAAEKSAAEIRDTELTSKENAERAEAAAGEATSSAEAARSSEDGVAESARRAETAAEGAEVSEAHAVEAAQAAGESESRAADTAERAGSSEAASASNAERAEQAAVSASESAASIRETELTSKANAEKAESEADRAEREADRAEREADRAAEQAESSSVKAVSDKVDELTRGAPEAFDTLAEIAEELEAGSSERAALTKTISGKADKDHTHEIEDVQGLQDALDEKANRSWVESQLEDLSTNTGGDTAPARSVNVRSNFYAQWETGAISGDRSLLATSNFSRLVFAEDVTANYDVVTVDGVTITGGDVIESGTAVRPNTSNLDYVFSTGSGGQSAPNITPIEIVDELPQNAKDGTIYIVRGS